MQVRARSDDELLATLAEALAPAVDPSVESELTALRRAVAARWPEGSRPDGRWHRPRLIVAAVAATLVMGSGAVLAATSSLERPLRVAADAVGLPVDPPRVTDVRDALHRLEGALLRDDRAEVEAAAAELRAELDDLHDGEARALAERAAAALERADQPEAESDENEAPDSTPAPVVPVQPPTGTPASGSGDHEDDGHSDNSGPGQTPTPSDDDDGASDSPPPTIEPAEGTEGGADTGADTAGGEALGQPASGGSDDEPRPED